MAVSRLIEIMAALRTPGTGCPWDLAQTSASIAPYAIEEAYEVVDAIERGDDEDLKDELGDLLLQVVFHARLAEEAGAFDFADVTGAICEKMVRRHPHVFATATAEGPEAVTARWSEIKAAEKAARQAMRGEAAKSLLDGVPLPLPALTRAAKLQEKAARVGFDWRNAKEVLDKLREETLEVEAELTHEPDSPPPQALFEEVGDLLFVVANLARKTGVDPEQALRAANAKFERRFHHIEERLADAGRAPQDATLEEMEALWIEAKVAEK